MKFGLFRDVGLGSKALLLLGWKQQRGAEGDSSGVGACPGLAVKTVRVKAWPAAVWTLVFLRNFLASR